VTRPEPEGTYPVTVTFAGSSQHLPAATQVLFTVVRVPTTLTYNGASSGFQGEPATLSALLVDARNNQPIGGGSLSFTFDGAPACTSTTEVNGVGACQMTPQQPKGSYLVTAAYPGDVHFLPSAASAPFFVIVPTKTGRAVVITLRAALAAVDVADTGDVTTEATDTRDQTVASVSGPMVEGTLAQASVATQFKRSTAEASVQTLEIALPSPLPAIRMRGVRALSESGCAEGSDGECQIDFLAVGDNVLVEATFVPKPNTTLTVPGGLLAPVIRVVLNEHLPRALTGGSQLTVNAVRVSAAGLAELVVCSARSDIHDCVAPMPA
jgi:hypothetical protein